MAVLIRFDSDADHVRAVGLLSEAEETYHGVAQGTILVSNAAERMLWTQGVHFQIVGGEKPRRKEEEPE